MRFNPNFDNLKHSPPGLMFHYSPRQNRTSILKTGLHVHPWESKIWDIQYPGVYMFADPLQAWHWQHQTYKTFKKEQLLAGDLWMINTNELDLKTDIYIKNALYCDKNLSITRIQLIPGQITQKLNHILYSNPSQLQYKFSLTTLEQQQQITTFFSQDFFKDV